MTFLEACRVAAEALQSFADCSHARGAPVIHQTPMAAVARKLDLQRLICEGGLGGPEFGEFLTTYLELSTRLHHPGYMAHQVAVPHPLSAIASLIDGFSNNAMAIYEMGPAAATVEFAVLNWMLGKVGWQPAPLPGAGNATGCDGGHGGHGGGVLTHGGSLANLTALLAARARVAPGAWEEGTPGNLVIVASEGCHYSIPRAAGVLGLGERAVRYAASEADGRLDPRALESFITRLQREGSTILAVVANACSTAVGLYDPLREIARVCRTLGVWLHVDGAHGASALLSERRRGLVDGIELADSLVWDAHKMLRAPTVCAAVLVADHRTLDAAFRENASYLFHDKEQPGFDFIHRTVECTKAALGLRVFFALAAEGEQGLAAYIDRQSDLALAVAELLSAEPDVEVAVVPQSNIVCFRIDGSDELQLQVRKWLTEAGNSYISTAEFRGRRWLRVSLMNPHTELQDIRCMLQEIRQSKVALVPT